MTLMNDTEHNNMPQFLQETVESYRNPVRDGRLRNNQPYRLPAHLTRTMSASTIPSSIKLWHELPRNIKEVRSNHERQTEIVLNKAKCDLIFTAHLFSHNFSNVPDPSCHCDFRAQTTKYLLLRCRLFNQARDLAFDNIINIPSFDGDMFLNSNQEDKFHLLLHGHHPELNQLWNHHYYSRPLGSYT
jgi:hypothetical protein